MITTLHIEDAYGEKYAVPGPFATIAEIKAANEGQHSHFFSPDTLRFFRSRIEPEVYGGRLFLTSEQFVPSDGPPDPRKWTIRAVDDDGGIGTVGEFQAFDSKAEAVEEVHALLRGEDDRR